MKIAEKEKVKESEAAKQLYKKLNNIINDIDQVVDEFEKTVLVDKNIINEL